MNSIVTKFGIGDVVFRIHQGQKLEYVTCPKCSGRGFHLMDNSEKKTCDCSYGYEHRGKISHWSPRAWMIEDKAYHIKSIDAKVDSFGKKEVRYPTYDDLEHCSGTLYKEEDCFATEAEALEECSCRNQADQLKELKRLEEEKAKKKTKVKT